MPLKLFRDGKYLGSREVRLRAGAGGKNVFVFPQTVEKAGASTFEAQIESRLPQTPPSKTTALWDL